MSAAPPRPPPPPPPRPPRPPPAARRRDHRVEHLRIARRDGQIRLDHFGQARRQLLPRRAAVRRLEDAAGRAADARRTRPLRYSSAAAARAPRRRCSDCSDRCGRRSRSCTRPCRAPSGTSCRRRSSERSRAPRSDRTDGRARRRRAGSDRAGSTSIIAIICVSSQAEMRPRLAGVGRLVDAVAGREVGPDDAAAGADVDDVRIGRRDGDRADRSGRLAIEERLPVRAVVGRAPDAAVVEADVEDVRLARHAATARARVRRASGRSAASASPTPDRRRRPAEKRRRVSRTQE